MQPRRTPPPETRPTVQAMPSLQFDSLDELIDEERHLIDERRLLGGVAIGYTEVTEREEERRDVAEQAAQRKETLSEATERIRQEAREVAAFLKETELPTEVAIVRTDHSQKRVTRDKFSGWILTSSFRLNSLHPNKPGPHQGLVLGADGEIYSYNSVGLDSREVESGFTNKDSGLGMSLVKPIQIQHGYYDEGADVMDIVYRGAGFVRGVQNPDSAYLIHGDGVRGALANLVALAESRQTLGE